VLGVIYVLVAQARGLYRLEANSLRHLSSKILTGWALVCVLFALFCFVLKAGPVYSRGSVLSFFFLGGVGLLVGRSWLGPTLSQYVQKASRSARRVILVVGSEGPEFSGLVNELVAAGCAVAHVIALPPNETQADRRGRLEPVARCAVDDGIEKVIVALPLSRWGDIGDVKQAFRICPIPVALVADSAARELVVNPRADLGRRIAIELQRAPLTYWEQAQKRALDVLIAAVCIAALSPLLILAAVAVKATSKGPAIFRQKRNGFGGGTFWIYKFRTMTVTEDGEVFQQARRGDARITPIGAILRRSSLDELPQLFNVLNGTMSLVGPRPHAIAHNREFDAVISDYAFRHHVKPGITGWAQVNGHRGETRTLDAMTQRVEHDLWYIDNWSPLLDIRILFLTAIEVIRGRNAG
jgi:Undecaprenyl-phosphate glucose phosphotransferase